MGLLSEQSALFPPIPCVPRAGVLLALSLLSITGLLDEVQQCLPVLPNGLYGSCSIITTLVAMAMLRCKRAEQLKGFDPTTLGAVVGLARAPEMKTLRRKHRSLAADEERVKTLVRAMGKRHVERAKDAIAFLYVDGHVRPYFGDESGASDARTIYPSEGGVADFRSSCATATSRSTRGISSASIGTCICSRMPTA